MTCRITTIFAASVLSLTMTLSVSADEEARNVIEYLDDVGNVYSDTDGDGYRDAMRRHPFYANAVGDLQGTTVRGAEGAVLGTISGVGQDEAGRVFALVSSGGILGLGAHVVALPLDRMILVETDIRMDALTETGFETLPEYEAGDMSVARLDELIGTIVDRD